jgi:hypothetical protein
VFLFIDESGSDRKEAPYEVLAGISVSERKAWSLIQAIQTLQTELFGVQLSTVLKEFKGSQLLHRKRFRLASQLPLIPTDERRDFTLSLLEKGRRARETGVEEKATRAELTAYAQASLEYADALLSTCADYGVKVFASMVETSSPRPNPTVLRKDVAYLFERFYYSLQESKGDDYGIVVFDELDVTQSQRISGQMRQYFSATRTGQRRAEWIFPEPFFVHSDLTTLVQVADLVAYCLNWGWRLPGKMTKATRGELEPFGVKVAALQYRGRVSKGTKRYPVYGICHIKDLRPKGERVSLEPKTVVEGG